MSAAIRQPSGSPAAFQRFLHSFRFRLTLLFVGILAIILAGFSLYIYTRQTQILQGETANGLVAQSAQLAAYFGDRLHSVEEEGEGRLGIVPQGGLPLLPENAVLAVMGPDGKWAVIQQGGLSPEALSALINSWSASPVTLEPVAFTAPENEAQRNSRGQAYLFEVSPLPGEREHSAYLLLAGPVDAGGQLPRLAISLVVSSALILLIAFGGGYWLADRAMKPVQSIVQTARRISASDLDQRLNLDRQDEIGELAGTFDQMLDRLEAAFERQRQFTADASHELRSPLAIIELESGRILERKRTPEEYEKVLRLIQSENEWMSRLVNELLLLARMDAGQTATRAERLDLGEMVVDVTERLAPLARARGVSLETGDLEECYVRADPVYLALLLTNLVGNAIKFTQMSDGRVLAESASQVLDGRPCSLVRISDNGPGIPEEHLAHIFDRFYSLDQARVRREDEEGEQVSSSGLGLAIARSIAEAYGGTIEVESQPGAGATFTVRLPAA